MSTSTLTDRYVHDVVRRLPADQRQDVATELRGTIADTIEARRPEDAEQAEHAVLTEMGDPIHLAAQYADRPNVLIGPTLYSTYIRLLVILLCTVLPLVTVALVIIDVLDGVGAEGILGTVAWAVFGVGAQIIAWTTVVFALLERAQRRRHTRAAGNWSPKDLTQITPRDRAGGSAWASAVFSAAALGLIVWQQVAQPFRTDAGEQIAILDPALWNGWIWPLLIGLGAAVVAQLLRIISGGWTRKLVLAYLVIEVLQVVPMVWILYQQELFNPAFLAEVNQDWTTPDEVYTGAAVIVVILAVGGVVGRFRQIATKAS